MPVTITYTATPPVIDADADTWGDKLNTQNLNPIKVDLNALATQGNASEPLAAGALQKAGGTMTGEQLLADVAPTSPLSSGFRGLPQVNIDADRTFVLTDAGKMIRCVGTTGRTFTIPTNAVAAFPIGTAIMVRNYQNVNLTLTRSATVTLAQEGSQADTSIVLAPFTSAVVIKEDTNLWFAK